MNQPIKPEQLSDIGSQFYNYLHYHIEELERNYLAQMPKQPFVHFAFHCFIDHYQQVYNSTHNKN